MAKSTQKPLTKTAIAALLAEQVGISKKQVAAFFEAFTALAYKQAKTTQFVIPGIGRLYTRESPAREMVMQFGEKKGQIIKVAKKKKVRFRVAKAAQVAIIGPAKK
jgi:nucleoid DNA-binding protein